MEILEPDREFATPYVIELKIVRSVIEHDDFIDDLPLNKEKENE